MDPTQFQTQALAWIAVGVAVLTAGIGGVLQIILMIKQATQQVAVNANTETSKVHANAISNLQLNATPPGLVPGAPMVVGIQPAAPLQPLQPPAPPT